MAINFTNNSATIGTTEYFLASNSTTATYQTTVCILQVWIDLGNMAAGDEYTIRLYEKVNGSAARLVESWTRAGAQSKPGFTVPTNVVGEGWEVSVQKVSGTDRSIGWSLREVT